ncbi:MAG: serpin family protein, partial [Polyangiaceae bacterium]
GNMVYSPASIESCLAMASAGAKGKTADEMNKVLHLPNDPAKAGAQFSALLASWAQTDASGPTLNVANRLWLQKGYPFVDGYLALTHEKYFADAQTLDFTQAASSAQTINKSISDSTHGKITDLISPRAILTSTRIILTNAVYFKGKWQTPFDKMSTRNEPFTKDDSTKVTASMMHNMLYASYADVGNAQVLDLPYKGDTRAMSFTIVLPKTGTPLSAIEQNLTAEKIDGFTKTASNVEVAVSLPKFKATQTVSLATTLANLGMPTAFAPGSADFSGISTNKEGLYISDVMHKAFIQVDEDGTEAAAATAVMMAGAGAPQKLTIFKADHPFLFFLRDKTNGAVLFAGRLTDPSNS